MKISTIPVKRLCPNCGRIEICFRNENGILKFICSACGTSMVSKLKSRRHENVDVYAPKGEMLSECYLMDMGDGSYV